MLVVLVLKCFFKFDKIQCFLEQNGNLVSYDPPRIASVELCVDCITKRVVISNLKMRAEFRTGRQSLHRVFRFVETQSK